MCTTDGIVLEIGTLISPRGGGGGGGGGDDDDECPLPPTHAPPKRNPGTGIMTGTLVYNSSQSPCLVPLKLMEDLLLPHYILPSPMK